MDRGRASEILGSLHHALGQVYAGGDAAGVRLVLTNDVEWHVPGRNEIAGTYRGIDRVLDYFQRRSALAGGTLRLHPGELLVGEGEHVAALTDGSAVIGGREHRWSTLGLYRIRDGRIAACWLLPRDPAEFDRAWSAAAAERPAASPGAEPVLILTGAPGAGKTTVARALAGRYQRAVHLESDQFFNFIQSGYVPPWQPESHEQNTLVMQLVSDAAAGYAGRGYVTVIDGIVIPRWFLSPVSARLQNAGHRVAYAVLRAPLDTCIARRGDTDPAVVERLWREFTDLGALERHVIDVGDASPEDTAASIVRRLGEDLLIGPR